ncbi:AMP-binding protein [Shumkonia mesophila]|uniref:AMP-binding protein n=1 Tax=Shumkonia mesophila TaxID=2838854 RepID=UPI0029348F05|nr:AMP-binding protein [Shumkonia mesophila]
MIRKVIAREREGMAPPEDATGTEDDGTAGRRLLDVVAGLVAELHPGTAGPAPSLDSSFDRELALDSLSRVELVARVEAAFSVALPETVLGSAETPRELLRAVAAAQAAPGRRAGPPPAATPAAPAAQPVGSLPHRAETLIEALAHHAAANAGRTHIRFYADEGDGEVLTYGGLHGGAARVAAGLRAGGLGPGEAVILMLPTGPDYFLAFFGVLMAGGIPVPIYPPARPTQIEEHVRRHAGLARNCRAAAMITDDEARRLGRLLRSQVEGLRHVVTVAELTAAAVTADAGALPAVAAGDIAFLQYTSGSTGTPKGVTLTHANLLANVRAMGKALEVGPGDVCVSWLPLYHDMGLIGAWLGSLYHGIPLVLMAPLSFLGRPARWLHAIHRYRGTISAAPNFAYEMALRRIPERDLEGLDLASWRIAANGAEPVSPDTVRRFGERFAAFGFGRQAMMPMFGLAENCVGLAFSPLDRGPLIDRVLREPLATAGRAEPATADDPKAIEFVACGRPIPGHEMRVVDEAGREAPDRREGRLQFRGPSATSGYYRNPEATKALFSADGWLETGDRAYIADGDVYVTGRIKDIIIRAGRNIHPAEIEDAVGEHPQVRKGAVAVFGGRAADTGTERLIVLAETRRREPDALAALRADINGLIADLIGAPPDEVVLAPPNTVPKTSSGKIRRAASRELYEKGLIGRSRPAVWRQTARIALSGVGPTLRRARRRLGEWGYAAWFWLVLAVVVGPAVWLLVAGLPSARLRWRAARAGARLLFGLTGLRPRLIGAETLPPAEVPFVLVSNHMSYLDGCVLTAALPRPVAFVAKAELAPQFVAGTFLKRLGAVFVERFDARQSAADAARIAAGADGRPPLYFPEGTLTRGPGLLPFHLGAFVAAAGASLPVVPLALRGTRSVLRDGSWFPRRGRISITIGQSVSPAETAVGGDAWKTALALRDEVRRRVLELSGEPDLIGERSPLRDAGGKLP